MHTINQKRENIISELNISEEHTKAYIFSIFGYKQRKKKGRKKTEGRKKGWKGEKEKGGRKKRGKIEEGLQKMLEKRKDKKERNRKKSQE